MRNAAWLLLTLSLLGCDLLGVVCTSEARAGVAVTLVDSATGGRLVSDSALVLAVDGTYADTARLIEFDLNTVGLAYERAGNYRVDVRANGYLPWIRDNVRVSDDDCHVLTAELVARLQR